MFRGTENLLNSKHKNSDNNETNQTPPSLPGGMSRYWSNIDKHSNDHTRPSLQAELSHRMIMSCKGGSAPRTPPLREGGGSSQNPFTVRGDHLNTRLKIHSNRAMQKRVRVAAVESHAGAAAAAAVAEDATRPSFHIA